MKSHWLRTLLYRMQTNEILLERPWGHCILCIQLRCSLLWILQCSSSVKLYGVEDWTSNALEGSCPGPIMLLSHNFYTKWGKLCKASGRKVILYSRPSFELRNVRIKSRSIHFVSLRSHCYNMYVPYTVQPPWCKPTLLVYWRQRLLKSVAGSSRQSVLNFIGSTAFRGTVG